VALDYVIHGAGAIGSVIGARLVQAGCDVGLVARGAHLEALEAEGLTVEGQTEGRFDLPAAGSTHDLDVDDGTRIVLAMKSGDTPAALEAHADLYRDRPILCAQNGVSNEQLLHEDGHETYGCTVIIGAALRSPGVIWHSGAKSLTIGRWPTGIDDVCEEMAADLERGGLRARLHEHVESNKWGKLVRNLGNAYLALTDLPTQEASCLPSDRQFAADVQEEAADALDAAGIVVESTGKRNLRQQIDHLRTDGVWDPFVREDPTVRSYPSTWQDLTAGRTNVEVDHFNGAIVRLGEAHGVATPLNRTLRDLCEDAAARQLGPGTETIESLRAAAAAAG